MPALLSRLVWLSALSVVCFGGRADAGSVRGTVTLTPEVRALFDAPVGHWRVENGVIAVGPRVPDLRSEVVVVLFGTSIGAPKPDASATMELHGLRLDPRVVVVGPGATVLIKNADRLPHTLSVDGGLLSTVTLPAGQTQTVKVSNPGEFNVRDQDYPHIEGTLVVAQTPYMALVDDKGGFRIDAPDGKYTLKVFFRHGGMGGWVLSQPLEVGGRTTEVSLTIPSLSAIGGR